mmetsp:Transcript_45852/g.121184  ORF Transcript_45852/g.121184 Transcript_45852/m.121184 type:complete len:278 (-) Transcript_45852:212-1045(-)
MGRRVKASRDKALVVAAVRDGLVGAGDGHETLQDRSEDLQTRGNVFVRIAFFNQRGDDRDINTWRRDGQAVTHGTDKDIVLATDLGSRNDDLRRFGIVRVGDGMIEQTNATDDDPRRLYLFRRKVGGIANDHIGLGHLITCLDTVSLSAFVEQDLVNVLIQHEGSAVNGADSRKTFGQSAEAVDGIDVGRGTVARKRVHVRLQGCYGAGGGLIHMVFIEFETHGMGNELMRIRDETKIGIELTHGHGVKITTLMSFWRFRLVLINKNQKVSKTAFLE